MRLVLFRLGLRLPEAEQQSVESELDPQQTGLVDMNDLAAECLVRLCGFDGRSPELVEEIREVFEIFDKDGTGLHTSPKLVFSGQFQKIRVEFLICNTSSVFESRTAKIFECQILRPPR